MTPKERVKAALRHERADRIPVGERDWASNDFIRDLLGRESHFGGLKMYQALWGGQWDRYINGAVQDLGDLADRLAWDIIVVWANIGRDTPIEPLRPLGDDRYTDAVGNIYKYSEPVDRIFLVERKGHPPPNTSLDALSHEFPLPSEMLFWNAMMERFGKTHYMIGGYWRGWHPTLGYSSIEGLEPWVMALYEDPEKFHAEHLAGIENPIFAEGLREGKKLGLDAWADAWDLGYSGGPFVKPALFEKWVYPVLKKKWKMVHDHGLDVFFHQCGDNRLLMEMIVDAGADIIQSIQPEEHIEELKAKYGPKVTLMGGVSLDTLVRGTPEDVRRETRWALDTCAPGGGFILASQHSLPRGVKVENYQAMLAAKKDWEETHV